MLRRREQVLLLLVQELAAALAVAVDSLVAAVATRFSPTKDRLTFASAAVAVADRRALRVVSREPVTAADSLVELARVAEPRAVHSAAVVLLPFSRMRSSRYAASES